MLNTDCMLMYIFSNSASVPRSGASRADVEYLLQRTSEGLITRGIDDRIQTQSDVGD